MICEIEYNGAAGPSSVRVYQLHFGAERVAILAGPDRRLIAICANRRSVKVSKFARACAWPGSATQCSTTGRLLGVGWCMVECRAAQWLTRDARLIGRLRPRIANLLLENGINQNQNQNT